MNKLLTLIRANPVITGIVCGVVLVLGVMVHNYNSALRAQGAAEQRSEIDHSSRVLTEQARTVDDSVLADYHKNKPTWVNPTDLLNTYSASIQTENKANRNDPNRKRSTPDRVGRLYDGLCNTYGGACPDQGSQTTSGAHSTVRDGIPTAEGRAK